MSNSIAAVTAVVCLLSQVTGDVYVNPINLNEEAAVTYDELRYYAYDDCKNNKKPNIDIINSLIEIEKSFEPPPEMRGMLLAAACMESGYNPSAKGDKKFSKDKKTPMAIGILQQWPMYEKVYGTDRTDPVSAAMTWMQHIVRQIPKVKKQCRYRTDKRIWLAAWVTGIRYKKPGGRCNERPKHYKLLKRWHKKIKKDRADALDCPSEGECGC